MIGKTTAQTCLALCLLPLVSCSAPSAPPASPVATPTPVSTHPGPTVAPVPLPTSSPVPTPVPTFNPGAVAAIVDAGRARLAMAGVEPLCLRWENTDGDAEAEWVGLYLQPGEPSRLAAFVLDGDSWHDLQPLEGETYGLGEHPACELDVRDVNADGKVEVLVWGHAATSTDLLHVFVWDGATYMLLAPFEGKRGVRLENADGDLADEVVVGYDPGGDLVWEAVYTWDGSSYGWTWERYRWFYLDRPHVYRADSPEHAVIYFYLAIDDRDLPGAYDLLSAEAQAARSPEEWMVGFATTIAVEVGAVHEVSRTGDTATVVAQVRTYDNVDGRIIVALWDAEWVVVGTPGGWRLDNVTTAQLDQWEAVYYR